MNSNVPLWWSFYDHPIVNNSEITIIRARRIPTVPLGPELHDERESKGMNLLGEGFLNYNKAQLDKHFLITQNSYRW